MSKKLVTVRPDYYRASGGLRPWFARPLFPEPRSDSGGQGNALKLEGEYIAFIKELNRNIPALMQWLVKDEKDAIYLTKGYGKWDSSPRYYWPMIAIGFDALEVEEDPIRGLGGSFYKVTGLPINGEVNDYDFPTTGHVIHRVYTNNHGIVRDTPAGAVGFMPIFDPSYWGKGSGLYILVEDTIAYDPEYPIPLPVNWDEQQPGENQPDVYIVRHQAKVEPHGVLGAGREFTISGTREDRRGIWGRLWGGNRWILLYNKRRHLYLTSWRPA